MEINDKMAAAREKLYAAEDKNIALLEQEWAKYKYLILGKNPNGYKEIRALLKDKSAYPVDGFYAIVDESLGMPENTGWEINAAQHVFGYFRKSAETQEKTDIIDLIKSYAEGSATLSELKDALYLLAVKYETDFLTQSYYFDR